MSKTRMGQGQKLIRKDPAQDRDASMHRLIWRAIRNWVPVPESTLGPSERASGARVTATPSSRGLRHTRVVLPAHTLPPVPDSNAHPAAMTVLPRGTKARADMDKLEKRAARASSDHAKSFLLRDPYQVLYNGQAGTRLH
jgi:hypothetical protein